jgi:hypothetical protein
VASAAQPKKKTNGCGVLVGGIIIAIILIAVVAGGESKHAGSHHARPAHSRRSEKASRRHHHFPRYAGLGAAVADFRHANNTGLPPDIADAPRGLAWYSILATSHGRVTEYQVLENDKPPSNDEERMFFVAGTMLPGYPVPSVRQSSTCVDYRDPALRKLIGTEWAEASTITGTATATMQAVKSPGCP